MTSGVTLGNLNGIGWVNLLIVGLIHTGVTYCMYFSSLKELPGQKAAILSYIDPLVAVAVSVFLLGEQLTIGQAVGGVLILGFSLLNEFELKKKAPQNEKEQKKPPNGVYYTLSGAFTIIKGCCDRRFLYKRVKSSANCPKSHEY